MAGKRNPFSVTPVERRADFPGQMKLRFQPDGDRSQKRPGGAKAR